MCMPLSAHMSHCTTHTHESLHHTYVWVTAPHIHRSRGAFFIYDTCDQRVIRHHMSMPLSVHMCQGARMQYICATYTHASLRHTYTWVTAPHIHMSHCAKHTHESRHTFNIWYMWSESHSVSQLYASPSTHESLRHTYTCVTAPYIYTSHCATHTHESRRHTYTRVTVHFLHMIHVIREWFGITIVCLLEYTWVTAPHIHMPHGPTHTDAYVWDSDACYRSVLQKSPTKETYILRKRPSYIRLSHCAIHTYES